MISLKEVKLSILNETKQKNMPRKIQTMGESSKNGLSRIRNCRKIKVSGVRNEINHPFMIELLEHRLGIDSKIC